MRDFTKSLIFSLTIEDGVMAITATIDRNVKVLITKASVRRHLKLGNSEEDEDVEDPSKQGRSLIEELDMDVDISLVPPHAADQRRKSDDTQVNGQPKDQLGGFSVAKVLEDATEQGRSVGNVQTYTRQKRRVNTANALVSTADVSTASEMVNITSLKAMDKGKAVMQESEPTKKIKKRIQVQMSIDEELAWKLHEEELARFNVEQEAIDIASVNDSQESVRKQRLEDDTEKKELKSYLDIVPKDEFVMEVKYLAT
nr:hypothetical protein [Tanacetum cinerariifolium]